MIRVLLALLMLGIGGEIRAQEISQPPVIVRAALPEEPPVVGQPIVLRVTVLVPTWLPQPPQFPSMETPNLIVRLPSRASNPVSETIEGETWSGVSRAYRLYPMVPGRFSLTQKSVGVTYADPETRAPISIDVPLGPIVFEATVPPGAEQLDPLIVAQGLTLTQELEGNDGVLGEGDALTRTVTAKITGSSALFLPPLIAPIETDAARAYPKEAAVSESEDRGVLSGMRLETTSYVAQFGGTLELPAISVQWFNTKTNKVETAQLNGATVEIDAPAAPREPVISRRQIVVVATILAILAATLRLSQRYVVPPVTAALQRRRARWFNSEAYASSLVTDAIRAHDLSQVYRALPLWEARCPGQSGSGLQTALAAVGKGFYGKEPDGTEAWDALSDAFKVDRKSRLARSNPNILPPLNPT
ncbi:hypothetical protein shim_22620 [Shimia sp. SK013]|uniref:BatD family protein n=1 Tax=Shimia sp. SK013 TaxID=1389006 RepID=UPI0006CCA63C|nr:BatD family protein [Shimia sp. SK013]KPA21555.1 hypothetical protein shim_22620 [Shimia sp. SK013]